MTTHLSETQLHDFVDGTLAAADRLAVLSHLESCNGCRTRVTAVTNLVSALHALPRESEPAPWVREQVTRDVRGGTFPSRAPSLPGPVKTWLVAATLMGLSFLGGRWSNAPRTMTEIGASRRSADAALAVQQSGSAYVTALAVLANGQDTTKADVLAQGREAGLAALYAAAAEFHRLLPDDPYAAGMFRAVADTREHALVRGLNDQVRF